LSFLGPVVIGIILAVPGLALVYFLSRERALDILAVQLGAIAAVYAGSSLTDGRLSVLVPELTAITAFLAVALFGRWGSPALLTAGYVAHGAWDALHQVGAMSTALPGWYAPFCLSYDWVFAIFVGALFLRKSTA
jgi:hypothetical protein